MWEVCRLLAPRDGESCSATSWTSENWTWRPSWPGSHFAKVRLAIRGEQTLFADPNNRRVLFTTRGGWAGKEFRSV